ncbi:hypothetical protein [Streptomyces sp. NPDC001880]
MIEALQAKLEAVAPYLDERQRRLLYAAEARQLGYGGIAAVAEASGVSCGLLVWAEVDTGHGQAQSKPRLVGHRKS